MQYKNNPAGQRFKGYSSETEPIQAPLINLLSARPIVLPCATPHKANTGSFRGTIFHVNYDGPTPSYKLTWVGVRIYRVLPPQGHVKVI